MLSLTVVTLIREVETFPIYNGGSKRTEAGINCSDPKWLFCIRGELETGSFSCYGQEWAHCYLNHGEVGDALVLDVGEFQQGFRAVLERLLTV